MRYVNAVGAVLRTLYRAPVTRVSSLSVRRSSGFLLAGGVALALIAMTTLDAARQRAGAQARLAEGARLVSALGLTDLALFTEARYTRHWTQADLHSAFQDHPSALEHFPSGSLVAPSWGREAGL